MIKVSQVEVLGSPVGNLWHVIEKEEVIATVTYYGNELVCCKGTIPRGKKQEIEKMIEELYNEN